MLGEKEMLKSNLKRILDERGMKQVFLASKLEVSKQSMHVWVKGKSDPSLEVAFKIAKELGCEVTDIWEYVEDDEE